METLTPGWMCEGDPCTRTRSGEGRGAALMLLGANGGFWCGGEGDGKGLLMRDCVWEGGWVGVSRSGSMPGGVRVRVVGVVAGVDGRLDNVCACACCSRRDETTSRWVEMHRGLGDSTLPLSRPKQACRWGGGRTVGRWLRWVLAGPGSKISATAPLGVAISGGSW